jgi:MFS transporter, SP family, sugar:H+ symporter
MHLLTNTLCSFVVAFTLPYLLDAPYADLGSQLGFIYGSMSLLSLIFGYFFLPELKNRSLEQVETMFQSNVPMRKFGDYPVMPDDASGPDGKIAYLDEKSPNVERTEPVSQS